jgi:hypothetical protein
MSSGPTWQEIDAGYNRQIRMRQRALDYLMDFVSPTIRAHAEYLASDGPERAREDAVKERKRLRRIEELEKELIKAGSSMEKVLKVTVYLNDIADYSGMNEIYKGRFGKKPPVRSTLAVAKGGVPGDSLVEMDAIAYI